MTPAAQDAASHTISTAKTMLHFSEKTQDADAKKNILCQWGYTGKKMWFYKKLFRLYVNGDTQEGRWNFIKIFFNGGAQGWKFNLIKIC